MPSRQVEQLTFETGEVTDTHTFRADLAVRNKSLKRARNVRIRVSGAVDARPGTVRLATLPGDGIVREMIVQDTVYVLVLTDGRLDVWSKAGRSLVQSVTGCPWTLAMIQDDVTPLVIDPYDRRARVFHPTMPEQVIAVSAAGAWTVVPDATADGIGGSKRQAYYRFADSGVSLTPSGSTGAITLASSAPYFASGHVGVRLRLQGREVEITGFTDAQNVAATVIQQLYPTYTVPVETSVGYEVGEIVQGRDTQSQGEIVGIPSGTSLTVLMQTFTPFFYDAAATPPGEQIIGANRTARVTGSPTITTDAAVLDWDEQAENPVRGYAATGTVHRNRQWKGRLPNVPFGILASAISDFQDFLVGTGDSDALFEEVGDTRAGVVRQVVSADQLLVGTSRSINYVPESEANPIRPTSFSLIEIGPDGVSPARPARLSEGVMFVENGGGSIIGVFPTGDVRRSWRAVDVSILSHHLIARPRVLTYVNGGETDPERYVYGCNAEGDMPVVFYSDSAEVFGWTLWETEGACRSLCAHEGEAWGVFRRMHGLSTVFSLEVFDPDRHMDASITVTDFRGAATGQTIETPDGDVPADLLYRCVDMAGATCDLMVGESYIGRVMVDPAGDFGVPDLPGAIQLGRNFVPEIETWPPQRPEDQRARRRPQRISRAEVRWRGRYLAINGTLKPVYRGGEDTSQAPPLRDELATAPMFGWSQDPTATFSRPYPGPWQVLGIVLEVRD